MELLGVPAETIAAHGAVSAETAAAMAQGAVARAGVDLAVSVTGIAGPAAARRKPVGLVYLGIARKDGAGRVERRVFPGDRAAIRQAAVIQALLLAAESSSRRIKSRLMGPLRSRVCPPDAVRRAVELPARPSKAATMRRTASWNNSSMTRCRMRDLNSKSTKKSSRQPPGTRLEHPVIVEISERPLGIGDVDAVRRVELDARGEALAEHAEPDDQVGDDESRVRSRSARRRTTAGIRGSARHRRPARKAAPACRGAPVLGMGRHRC